MRIESIIRALDDPTRLRIMRLLSTMELAVGELATVLGQSQPRVSRHVAILCDAGLAERRREGSWVFLRQAISERGGGAMERSLAHLLAAGEAEDAEFADICAADRRHLAAIRDTRERSAAEYFARHAGEWDNLRALLVPADQVEAALLDALADAPLGRLLDIGTGTGRIAELLAPSADHIVALDKSPEMLRLARARLQGLPATSVELVQGDFGALPLPDGGFDTVIFHQVLHYAQEPAYALAEAARVCRPGGRIAIVDLAAHGREELRSRHAHARLGFADEQMRAMLGRQGFVPAATRTLDDGQLAVNIWTGTRKGDPVTTLDPARRRTSNSPTKKAQAK
ncbi:MAG: metalloregulator ArsR/SmtB family transcription factor [Sphingomonadales bacterium]|nr:metalloregulator ArsR/SmtB family transcription factor [Sphingomonadales bacterium]MBD3772700.1 metalloregulator ArsR/SmtB family transcription factor [Paracoccaceae bacterium]